VYDVLTVRVAARYLRAIEFPSEEAKKKYLQEHPGADPAKHTVKEHGEAEKGAGKEPSEKAKGWLARATGEVKSFFTDPKARQESLNKAAEKLKAAPAEAGRKAIAAVKDQVAEAKEAFAGVKTVMGGGSMSDSQKAALKKVALKTATSIAASALVLAFPATIAHSVVGNNVAKHVAKIVMRKALGAATGLKLAADIADAEEMLGTTLAVTVAEVLEGLSEEDVNEILESAAAEPEPV
jgi:hypothetical protein